MELSDPGQIAYASQAAVLADGTVIVSWIDALDDRGDVRPEVALREPGAAEFHTQVLPGNATALEELGPTLLSGGTHAAVRILVSISAVSMD